MNSDKIILDLCGGTGAWSKPYRDAGYKVHLLTLPHHDVTKVGHDGRSLYVDKQRIPFDKIYGILAAPPCTEFSLAKGSRPRDFEAAMQVVHSCMHIVWYCRTFGNLKF
ncbi:MAG: hypothetical protein LBU42_00735 [Prevotellaceae bacterium]|nr:hypothetical protein [Prevotellaceae bacterium]